MSQGRLAPGNAYSSLVMSAAMWKRVRVLAARRGTRPSKLICDLIAEGIEAMELQTLADEGARKNAPKEANRG